jgi:hypothetical protein
MIGVRLAQLLLAGLVAHQRQASDSGIADRRRNADRSAWRRVRDRALADPGPRSAPFDSPPLDERDKMSMIARQRVLQTLRCGIALVGTPDEETSIAFGHWRRAQGA